MTWGCTASISAISHGRQATTSVTAGFLVDAPFAAFAGELEVLDRVRLVRQPRIDVGVFEGTGKQSAGGTDEGFTRTVLLIPRLLTDQHDRRPGKTATEHRLGSGLEKRAAAAPFGRRLQ